MEQEWYDNVRNGGQYLCDRDNSTILNKDEFFANIKRPYHYCRGCWNYMKLRKWKCNQCQSTGSIRSEEDNILKYHCEELVTWLQ